MLLKQLAEQTPAVEEAPVEQARPLSPREARRQAELVAELQEIEKLKGHKAKKEENKPSAQKKMRQDALTEEQSARLSQSAGPADMAGPVDNASPARPSGGRRRVEEQDNNRRQPARREGPARRQSGKMTISQAPIRW